MFTQVSIIIPVYNDQAGIEACLAALSVQTYPSGHYEVVVVDNASSPPIRLGPEFSKIARLVVCSTSGSYAARNAGIAVAHGDVLAFTDADCVPDQDWITAGVAALAREKERCIIGGEVALSLSEQPTAVERYQYLVGFMQRENIEDLGFAVTANLFTTKTQIESIGLFNESLLSGGDREWSWRATEAGFSINYAPEALVCTVPRKSLTSAIRQARRVAGGRFFLRRIVGERTNKLLKPHRSLWASIVWLLTYPKMSVLDRSKVFIVALILKTAHLAESIRLSLAGRPERR